MSIIKNKRILDLSRIIAGPYATMILADYGCEVIKVESPEGDPSRQWGPPWHQHQSAYFLSINRNKKSICLNFKEEKCRQALYKLVQKSDAVIENFIPGTTERLKIDFDTLKQFNKKLTYVSVSGFGDVGSRRFSPAFDNLIQAETGFMHLTGDGNGDPYKLGFAVVDVVTSLYAANSVMAGLLHQEQTGEALHMKTSLYECAVSALINQASNYLNGHVNPHRMGNHHPNIVPYGLYKTKTLPIIICVGTPLQYEHLVKALKLNNRQQFMTNQQRVFLREDFDVTLNQSLRNYTIDQAMTLLETHRIPCGRVNDLKSLFQGETIKQLKMVEEVNNKKFLRSPVRCDQQKFAKITQPPTLNQHGRELLAEVGLSSEEIEEIQELNKIKQ